MSRPGWLAIDWTPIGDPTWLGWLITAAYLTSAFLAFTAYRRGHSNPIWLVIGGGMLLLGMNKQLDLHELVRQVARVVAYEAGWYSQRRLIQAVFGSVIVLLAAAAAVTLYFVARSQTREVRLALAGAALVMGYVTMRVAYFEHLGMPDYGDGFNAIVELGGITCVAGGAWQWRRRCDGRL